MRLRANGALLSLGWNELQLTLDEVRAICAGQQCKDEWLLQALLHQSQGWVAGLTLMLERLGHFDGETQALPSDTRESVFHYFAEMIFDQVPPRVRETLLSLAFVRSVTPRIACELSGDANAPALLEDLYRRRMFTERRQDDEPVYQFHALFREFLDSRVRRDYALAALVALMCRSAAILEALWEEYQLHLRSLGVTSGSAIGTLLWDGRYSLLTAVLAGFGRANAEVGAVMIVGGNIDHVTRVMTTAIALEASRGDLALALGLGIILLLLSLTINAMSFVVRDVNRMRNT